MAKLRPEVKAKVLEALRSGRYKKAPEHMCVLRTPDNCFCVMGVMGDLVAPDRWVPPVNPRATFMGCYQFDGETAALSLEVLAMLGLERTDEIALNSLNDDSIVKRSFETLADIIEERY